MCLGLESLETSKTRNIVRKKKDSPFREEIHDKKLLKWLPQGVVFMKKSNCFLAHSIAPKMLFPPGIPAIPLIPFLFRLAFAGTLDSAPRKTYPEFRFG